jgi:formate dehydrogenase iron-sulfur subunit
VSVGLLIDTTRCIDCGACSAACKEQNQLPLPVEAQPTAYTWTTVETVNGVHVRRMCMHCLEPTCVSVCPVGALQKTVDGPVVYDATRCIGCRYCIMACPFDVPKYEWDQPIPIVGKCVLCAERVGDGLETACAAVCPTGATLFGEREDLVREARSRIDADPTGYVDHIYGLEEAGGTSVLMLAGVDPEQLGLPTNVPRRPLPGLTWQVLHKIPEVALIAGVFLFGIRWITERRDEVRDAARGSAAGPEGGAR